MKKIDTLLIPRWIVPIEPHNTVLEHHAIAIDKGRILNVLPAKEAQQQYEANTKLELSHHVVLPGLVNAHTHSPMTLFRGLADDLALMDWLNNHIWPAERHWMDDEFIYDGTQIALAEMLRSGTTCFNENYFFTDTIARATEKAGMRGVLATAIIDFPSRFAKTPLEYIEKADEFYQAWKNHPLIKPAIAPQGPYTVDDNTFLRIKEFADKHQLTIHLHLHETLDEINQSLQQYKKRPLERIRDLGLISNRLQCIHMVHITADELAMLQGTGIHVVHCPDSNLKLASGFCPIEQYIAHGINVAIGTDGAASNNDLDMFGEIRTTALVSKAVTRNPTASPAAETLRMATLNGARALGLEHEIGSIEIGKAADIIAVDLESVNTQPVYHPISHLVYAVNSRQVTDVWVAGKRLLQNGEFTTLDQNEIFSKAKEWSNKILTHRVSNKREATT